MSIFSFTDVLLVLSFSILQKTKTANISFHRCVQSSLMKSFTIFEMFPSKVLQQKWYEVNHYPCAARKSSVPGKGVHVYLSAIA